MFGKTSCVETLVSKWAESLYEYLTWKCVAHIFCVWSCKIGQLLLACMFSALWLWKRHTHTHTHHSLYKYYLYIFIHINISYAFSLTLKSRCLIRTFLISLLKRIKNEAIQSAFDLDPPVIYFNIMLLFSITLKNNDISYLTSHCSF